MSRRKPICPFLIGNSEIKCGFVEFNGDLSSDIKNMLHGDVTVQWMKERKEFELDSANKNTSSDTVMLFNVPPFLIPQDYIQFLGAYLGTLLL